MTEINVASVDYRVVWGGVKGWNVATVVFWHKKGLLRRGFFATGYLGGTFLPRSLNVSRNFRFSIIQCLPDAVYLSLSSGCRRSNSATERLC